MFVLIKEVVFVEWFRIRKIPVRIPRNFKLNSENSEKSSINCTAQLWDMLNNFCFYQRRAEQLVLDFSEFSEFSLKFRGIRNGILRIRNHSTNTTSGLDKQILYTTTATN